MEVIEVDIAPVLTPREALFAVEQGRALGRRLDGSIATSPIKAAIAGAALGALFALAEDRPILWTVAVGAAGGAALAHSWRVFAATGYACGLCEGMNFGKFGSEF